MPFLIHFVGEKPAAMQHANRSVLAEVKLKNSSNANYHQRCRHYYAIVSSFILLVLCWKITLARIR
jgi:hypothetical protein